MNTLFRIAFGDYEFVLDRTSLTYSLTETVTKTVWAAALSLGWIELKECETGTVSRTDFGDCKLISIAEKMGAAGKRILLGLDAPGGVPVDIYLICGPKEIQLTVEASRDSKTHLLERVGLLPGLCRVGESGALVLPIGDGRLLPPKASQPTNPEFPVAHFPVWSQFGLNMPFLGAIQSDSALSLITDSAYACAEVIREDASGAIANWVYLRDPERRRLDVRIALLPHGDHIAVARTYRDKLVGERNHITLRKKLRERSALEKALSSFWCSREETKTILHGFGIEAVCEAIRPIGNQRGLDSEQRWEEMELLQQALQDASNSPDPIETSSDMDWLAPMIDVWGTCGLTQGIRYMGYSVPLKTVVYHDSVVSYAPIFWVENPQSKLDPRWPQHFLRALLMLAVPTTSLALELLQPSIAAKLSPTGKAERYRAIAAVLCPLSALTFPAFLTAHKFLTPDFLVEEAFYSDKTRVVINQSETEAYDAGEFLLPPGGFYVRHPQFEAHDVLRVGAIEFPQRAWRVRRSLDGKPLEQSEQVEEREFEVS